MSIFQASLGICGLEDPALVYLSKHIMTEGWMLQQPVSKLL